MLTGPKTCKPHATGHNKSLPQSKWKAQLRDGRRPKSGLMRLSIILMLSWLCQRLHCVQLDSTQQKRLQLLERIRRERHYDTIVIYGGRDGCVFHGLLPQLEELATVLLTQGSSLADWNFSSELLLLSCGFSAEQERNTRTQLKLQQVRRLVHLEAEEQPQLLCEAYFGREQHNVAMLDALDNVYSCRCFQSENHVRIESNSTSIYVQQFGNMRGAPIKSEADKLAPRSMVYRRPDTGQLAMMGFVANVVNSFVERVNATLKLPEDLEVARVTNYGEILRRAELDQLDVAAALSSTLLSKDMDHLSYPVISSSYCFMVPVPAQLPYKEIFTYIVDPLVLVVILLLCLIFSLLLIYSRELSWRQLSLLNVLLNDRCLRGLLGQAFPLPMQTNRHLKAVCLLLCFASLMTTTMYESYLQSFFTHPPFERKLHSFADFRDSPYKVAMVRKDLNVLIKAYKLDMTNFPHLYLMNDWNEFVQIRDNFNSSYIYPITELRWLTYLKQQELFKEPLFYFTQDVCLSNFILLCLPLRRHLPYRQLFEQHLLFMHSFGLFHLWAGRSFYDMVLLNRTSLTDLSDPVPEGDIVYLRDLSWIFLFYLVAHLLGCLCFLIECRWEQLRKFIYY